MPKIRELEQYEFRVIHKGSKKEWKEIKPITLDLHSISPDSRHDLAFAFANSLGVHKSRRADDSHMFQQPIEVRFNRVGSSQGFYVGAGYRRVTS